MSEPIRIRTASGEVIDIDETIRQASKIGASKILALSKALKAALSVQESTPPTNDWQYGWNACKNQVLADAGVIENEEGGA